MAYLKEFGLTLISFLIIDMVWLTLIAKNLYQKHLGYIMASQVNWAAALIFYLLFIAGIVFFVLHPALLKNQWQYALLAGAFFGLVTYATYDLTNLATLKDWPVFITVIDLIWGSCLSGGTSLMAFVLIKRFFS